MKDIEIIGAFSEYKPLAKVEELEEQNYNMIDNVLNNGAGTKKQEQAEQRMSVKEKLSQKKAEIEQKSSDSEREKSMEKKTEKSASIE